MEAILILLYHIICNWWAYQRQKSHRHVIALVIDLWLNIEIIGIINPLYWTIDFHYGKSSSEFRWQWVFFEMAINWYRFLPPVPPPPPLDLSDLDNIEQILIRPR